MPPVPVATPEGTRIRALIRERGYTVTGFARKIGRHRQTIWDICGRAGGQNASVALVRQIARELRVPVSEISDMDDDGEPEPAARRCPSCGAEPGDRCVNPGGTPYSAGMHALRKHPAPEAA